MYIVPQSNFRLIQGVPFNSDYKDTIYFQSQAAQETYFTSKVKRSFSDFTYVRQTGAVRVPAIADDLFDCNYCMFKNVGFGQKWFYAFITGIEYINNDVTEITFAIDFIQTWLFDFSLGYCYIEREHVADDTIGKHTISEQLPLGDLVENVLTNLDSSPIAVLSVLEGGTTGQFIDGVYSPLRSVFGTAASINSVIAAYDDTPEKVASLHMSIGSINDVVVSVPAFLRSYSHDGDSYTPRNNKLYVYPYNFLTADDYGSNSETYNFEDFNGSVQFKLKAGNGGGSGAPYAILRPQNFKGIVDNYNYAVLKTDFPHCCYNIDNFRAWASNQGAKSLNNLENAIENQSIANMAGMIGSLSGGVGSMLGASGSKNPMAGNAAALGISSGMMSQSAHMQIEANNLLTAAENLQTETEYQKIHGNSIGGSVGSASALWQAGKIGFQFKQHHIKPEFARVIDDFFTRFGYKTLHYAIPDVTSRANFNYIKTIECEVRGNIPNYANVAIQKIFNAGVTLWHKTDIGDYNTNPIV